MARKRGGGHTGESVFLLGKDGDSNCGIGDVLGADPTPEFQAMMAEQVEAMLVLLDDPGLRDVALRKMKGYSNEEISELLSCTTRTVKRWLRRIRDKWDNPQ